MAKSKTVMTSFNAGEISPLLEGRVDVAKTRNGARTMKNVIAGLYGQCERRPGSRYVGGTFGDNKARLMDWEYSTTTSYILVWVEGYLRFISNGAELESGGGSPVTVVHNYTIAECFLLQIAQINDIAYITCPGHPSGTLTRLAADSWTLADTVFEVPPMLDQNLSAITLTPSATSGTITITASGAGFSELEAGFQDDHVGSYWRIGHLRESTYEEESISANVTGTGLKIIGDWQVRTYGVWNADILIQRSADGSTNWETIRKFSGKEDRNIDQVGTQDTQAYFRVKIENRIAPSVAGATTPRVVIEAVDADIWGTVKITARGSATSVTATVITALESTDATTYWAEGAWSDVRGYPRAVAIFEQRVWYAGSEYQIQTVWASATDDYLNFDYGALDTDALAFTLATKKRQTILWMAPQKAMLIGTTSGEHAIASAGDSTSAITPTNVSIRPQSEHGSAVLEARLLGDVIVFVQRNTRKVRELTYRFDQDKFVAPDLTLVAEHITAGGIVQLAVQQLPYNTLWAVTGNGKLISMTYEREQDVVGWTHHETQGTVESVAVVFGTRNDEVYIVVKRTINGYIKRYVERMHNYFSPNEGDTKQDAFFLDSALTYDAASTATDIQTLTAAPLSNVGSLYTFTVSIQTVSVHGLTDGDVVRLEGSVVFGLAGEYAVDVASTTTFYLLPIDQEGQSGPWVVADRFKFTFESPTLPSLAGGTVTQSVKTLTGLGHLTNMEVQVLADGAVETHTVRSGSITLQNSAVVAHVGLSYESILKPQKLDVDPSYGMTMGQTKRITQLFVRMYSSLGLKVGDGAYEDDVNFRGVEDTMDASPPLFTGDLEVEFDGGYGYEGDILIKQDQPLPMTILAIIAKYDING